MPRRRHVFAVLCAAAGLAVLSCESQPPPVNVYDVVAPQIIKVSSDGLHADVNIGMFDGMHAGQRLYVVRDQKLAGMLTVTRPLDYSSECVVVASNQVSDVDPGAEVDLKNVRVSDLVVTRTKYISGAGLMKERVPRMVPVPYDAYDSETETLKVGGREIKIPRDQVEQWKKDHPLPKTGSSFLDDSSPKP